MEKNDSLAIQAIDKSTVNRICSGQVVLNLATAVKELLENSIDAGATSVQIKFGEYGSEFIEVIDNGCGVEEANFQALTLKHHTSKIKEFIDVYSVETFGFRGEALSSLCSLSDVTITTQHQNSVIGSTLKFDHNGIITSNVKTLRKTGTTVRLENLFCTLPVRRTEFLKNLKREFSKTCNVLYAYGLQSSGVRITCVNQVSKAKVASKETLEQCKRSISTTIMDIKGESLENNIISIFGIKQKQNLIKVTEVIPSHETLSEFGLENKNLDVNKFKLDGYISSCAHGCGRASSDRQFYFINSRPVDNNKISKLVNDVYHHYNNRQDPFVAINIKVENGSFDLNVTPDKRQILLQHETLLLAVLKESLHEVFKNIPSILDMQNVGINKTVTHETVKPSEVVDNFKDHFRKLLMRNERKEPTQSHIDDLGKFQLSVSKKKDHVSVNLENKECDTDSLLKSKDTEIKSEIKFKIELVNESTEGFREGEIKLGRCNNSSTALEEVPSKAETVSEKINQNKRKASEQNTSQIEVKKESDETISKRMRYDQGLNEDDKKNRKCINHSISLLEIKQMRQQKLKTNEEKVNDVKFLTEIKPQNNERAEKELKKEISKDNFKQMEIIGQFNLGFIITKLNSDIFIIDQHASDEKYNFETLQSTTIIQSQKLFNPEKLELTVDREELMLQHREIFKKNGFDFEFNVEGPPTRRISLTAIPFSKNTLFGKEDIDELLFFLENTPESTVLRPSRVSAMFASRACRKSVMIGTPLNHQEMRKIVDHMGEIEQPWNCPHGRPTMRHLVNLNMINS